MKKLTHEEIVSRQKIRIEQPRIPITVVLNDIRSLHNVGSIFRTADGAGLEKIILCGITGYPPNNQITKTALGAEDHVDWEYSKDMLSAVQNLKKKGYKILLLEQTKDSVDHSEYDYKFPICLILGNEISGVSDDILSLCDGAIEIEMIGVKNSLNVSVAFGIVAYHMKMCFKNVNMASDRRG